MTNGPATALPDDVMDQLREIVLRADPDPIVIAVLTGSPARDLAVSVWTRLEGHNASAQAVELLTYALHADER